jgi:hypothetical protein
VSTIARVCGVAVFALVVASCGETSRRSIERTLDVAGTTPEPFVVDGFTVTLDRADVAFGPLYACAAVIASLDLCETSIVESLVSATIDGLDPVPQRFPLVGTTGIVRSVMYDHGLTWRFTDARPVATDGAVEGHSMAFAGHAERGAESFDFTAAIDVRPASPGAPGVFGVETPVQEVGDVVALRLAFDPIAWWSTVDFEALAARAALEGGSIDLQPGDPVLEALLLAAVVNVTPAATWE